MSSADKRDSDVALSHASELRPLAEVSWGELREQTARIATGLRRLGVEEGDRVVAYLPNVPEALAKRTVPPLSRTASAPRRASLGRRGGRPPRSSRDA